MTTTIPSLLLLRDARDRLIDLLGFGQTYPLRDMDVQEQQLTVDFNQESKIDIEPGQLGVRYELYENGQRVELYKNGQRVDAAYSAMGDGNKVVIPGPQITADRTFRIRAVQTAHPDHPERSTYLIQTAVLKVGLDTRLSAYILNAELLNRTLQGDRAPRLVDYNSSVQVMVMGSQLGAQYSLSYKDAKGVTVNTTPAVLGTGGDIPISTYEITEDTQIRVQVARYFTAAEGRQSLNATLDAVLPLAVRARKAIALSVDGSPSPLIDPLQATITLRQSQKSVTSYAALVRKLDDSDFEFIATAKPELCAVPIPPSPDLPLRFGDMKTQTATPPKVYVRLPEPPADAAPKPGRVGTGNQLTLDLGAVQEDSIVVILATKSHLNPDDNQPWGTSTVLLDESAVVLPRPGLQPELAVTVAPATQGAGSTLTISGGQAGVYYHFRLTEGGAEIGLPAYFHRADDQSQNRGIGLLRIQTDFAIGGMPPSSSAEPPPPPVVDTAQVLKAGSSLSVNAVWARTGVAWTKPHPVQIK